MNFIKNFFSNIFGGGFKLGSAIFLPVQGGTGTSTKPNLGEVLVGQADGTYEPEIITSQQLTCVEKTSNYTANPFELVNCDISAGSFIVTLPSAPADGTIIYAKLNTVGLNNYLTLKTSGTDKFNTPTGNTEIYMYLFGEYAQMQYCTSTGLWTTFISAGTFNFATNFPGVDATTPITYANISIDTSTRVLTITAPTFGGTQYFNIFVDGNGVIQRYRKTGTVNFPAFTDTSGTWFFYFNSAGVAVTTQTPWKTIEFPSIVPIYRIVWNKELFNFTVTAATAAIGDTYTNNGSTFTVREAITGGTTLKCQRTTGTNNPAASGNLVRATGAGTNPIVFSAFSEEPKLVAPYIEYHENDISADDHQWFHLNGTVWMNGFTMANNALTTGTPNPDGRNTVIALTTGSNVDDNLDYTVTNNTTGNPFTQDLGDTVPATLNATNSALMQTFVQDAGANISFLPATRFPFAWDTVTNRMQYITSTGTRSLVASGDYAVYFVYATQNPRTGESIKLVSSPVSYGSITNARAVNWVDIQNTYSILAMDPEIRPLYRLIFLANTAWDDATKNARLYETQDIRKAQTTSTTAATGSLPASSVTFVSYDGIGSTNVQSALEELADERLNLDQTTSQTISNGQPIQSTLTASELVATDASKKLSSLPVATYPSLTELSYVKGVTSGIQSQLNGKQATLTNPITGTGTANEIAYFPTTSTVGSLGVATYPSLTELSYVKGVTSAIQTQIGAKAPSASPTFTGTVTLADNARIDLTLPTADTYCTGPTTDSFASGYTSAAGDLVFMGSSSKWLEVDADAVATCKGMTGIALEAKNDTEIMKVALSGAFVRFDAWNWTVGATLYAGETLGAMQEAIPTGADAIIKVVGFAVNADTVYFLPSPDQQSTVA